MQFNFDFDGVNEYTNLKRVTIDGYSLEWQSYDVFKESILDIPMDIIKRFETFWEQESENNRIKQDHNIKLYDEAVIQLENLFENMGMLYYKTNRNGKKTGEYKEFKAMRESLRKKFNVYNGYEKPRGYSVKVGDNVIRNGRSPYTLSDLVTQGLQYKKSIKKKEEKENKELVEAIKLATKENINIEGMSNDTIIANVTEYAKEKHVNDTYKEGDYVTFDQCQECDSWTVGEDRCECGNRRVYLEVEGDLVDGFYSYPQAY